MRRYGVSISLLYIAWVILAGCAAQRTPYEVLYRHLEEEVPTLEQSVLEGRRIVIDPGHGGCFDGALGLDSLSESDVNLGVALYLWGMLEEAGAEVTLTRTTDKDFLPAGATELRDDLEERMREANSMNPEVFISIHHNSNIFLDKEINKIEIYYKGDDTGPSLELARDIHLHLARNLGIEETEIKPGNYFVLRSSEAGASILGEASYLSHPIVEDRLKLAAKQRLEAEAYFIGLVSYFGRGVPKIERFIPSGDTIDTPGELAFRVRGSAGIPLDPASARITIGDHTSVPLHDPSTGMLRHVLPADIPNGPYRIHCMIRSTGGATATSKPYTLLISRPAAFLLPLPAFPEPGDRTSLGVKVLDRLAQPVADGTPVTVRAVRGGETVRGRCRKGRFGFTVRGFAPDDRYVIESSGIRDTLGFQLDGFTECRSIIVSDRETGKTIAHPLATPFRERELNADGAVRGGSDGRIYLLSRHDGMLLVSANGYRPALITPDSLESSSGGEIITLTPVFNGTLHGKRIVLDPGGGGADPGGLGERKRRGSTINHEVARLLKDRLVRGGAHVLLTRPGEETLSPVERVYIVNRFNPDLAIGIHHGAGGGDESSRCSVHHYPGSTKGMDLAGKLATALSGLPPCEVFRVDESITPFIQQTSCTACEIHYGFIENESGERILENRRFANMEAERILSAILQHFGGGDWPVTNRTIRVVADTYYVQGAAVSIDQISTMITDEAGSVECMNIGPGRHLITIETPEGVVYGFTHLFTEEVEHRIHLDEHYPIRKAQIP
ncbi:MAG: N-acetylmuramoyl-L-alanine amidase [bacterium]|nr:MAG: N-acetylmuramoyl-L-alanine amidase [bacterium]